jgi:hypothetical protein
MQTRSEAVRDHARGASTRCPLVAVVAVVLATVAINLLQACSFSRSNGIETPEDVYAIIDAAPYVNPTEQVRRVVVNEPGKLHVEHGRSCAEATHAASETYIGMRITDNVRLPAGYTGTVYQNGYDLEYEDGDHEVVGLGSAVYNIHQLGDILFWDAGGVISDEDGDDAYRWCYAYTVVAWPKGLGGLTVPTFNQPRLDIEAVHANKEAALIYTGASSGALARIRGKFKSEGKKPRTVLPAGFATTLDGEDHAVLQFGFDLGTPRVAGRTIRWRSDAVLKDDDTHGIRAAELVSILGGDSVRRFQPQSAVVLEGFGAPEVVTNDLRLKPKGPTDCGAVLGTPALKTRQFAVSVPPFAWAMPVLTGWDMNETCDDEHKRRIGAWIEDFSYVRMPGEPFGTLRYTVRSAFGDADPFGFVDRIQVDVLGIDLIEPVLASESNPPPTFGAPAGSAPARGGLFGGS